MTTRPLPTPFQAILRFLIPLTNTLRSDTKVVRSDKLSLIPVCISARTDLISHISDNLSARRVKISLRTDTLSARTTSGWGRPHLYMGYPPYRQGGLLLKKFACFTPFFSFFRLYFIITMIVLSKLSISHPFPEGRELKVFPSGRI